MNSKTINVSWAISLFVIGIATVVLAGTRILGIDLGDTAVRIIGVIDLLMLPVLAYTTVKKAKRK